MNWPATVMPSSLTSSTAPETTAPVEDGPVWKLERIARAGVRWRRGRRRSGRRCRSATPGAEGALIDTYFNAADFPNPVTDFLGLAGYIEDPTGKLFRAE